MPAYKKKTTKFKTIKKKSNNTVASLKRQVMALTKRVGYPERFDTEHNSRGTVAAFDSGNSSEGSYVVNITPPTLHTTYSNVAGVGGRTGKSINLKSFQLRLRISSDVQRVNGGRVDIYMVRQPMNKYNLASPSNGTTLAGLGNFFEPDPWVSDTQGYPCYTTQSLRNMENAMYGKFRIIAKRTINFDMEAIGAVSAVGVKNVDIFKKYEIPIEYQLGTEDTQDVVKNPIYLIAVCDGGNKSAQTGFLVQHNIKYYYTDN